MSISTSAPLTPVFALEPLEDRLLLSAQPFLEGVGSNYDSYDPRKAIPILHELGATAVRIFNTTSGNSQTSSFADAYNDLSKTTHFGLTRLQTIQMYADAGFNVTLLVTPSEYMGGGTVPLNAPANSGVVTNYFHDIATSPDFAGLRQWVDRWEIVNEPNLPKYYNANASYSAEQNLTDYVNRVLKPAYSELHAVGETVVGGALSHVTYNSDPKYTDGRITSLKAAGYADNVDILNLHAYGDTADEVEQQIDTFKNPFVDSGKPLTLTEWNAHSDSDSVNQNNLAHSYIKSVTESQFYFRLGYTAQDSTYRRGLVNTVDQNGSQLSTYTLHQPEASTFQAWTADSTTPPPDGTRDAYARIEAESADQFQGNSATGTSPMHVGYFSGGDYDRFDGVNFAGGAASVELRSASPYNNGYFELRLDSPTGTLIGSIHPAATSGYSDYQSTSAPVTGASGTHSLYLVGVSPSGGGLPDVDWLQFQPASSQTLVATNDAFVRDGQNANTNYNTDTLEAKTAGVDYTRQAYLQFNVGSVGTSFGHANLRLWGHLQSTPPDPTVVTRMYRVNDNWSESAITYNNRPGKISGGTAPSAAITGDVGQWYNFDVTDYLRSERSAGESLFSTVAIADQGTTLVQFDSAESTRGHAPQLVIT